MTASGTTSPAESEGSSAKHYRTGTHRTVSPASTLARLKPYLRDMGITRLANVTGLDRVGIPVVMAMRPNSRSVAVSQGKGVDLEAAKASALMESVETWHAERITLPTLYGSVADLSGAAALADMEIFPETRSFRFDPTRRLLWIEADDLMTGEAHWIPYEMVHTDYTVPTPPGHGCFPCSTNGLASGNQVVEAQCHAICEVIERDATTLLHHMPRQERYARRVDLSTVDDAECRAILSKLADAGLEMVVWETTTDIGIASFYGLLLPAEGAVEHIGAGAGTHPSRAIALSRTLTEAIQTRLTYISGARDDLLEEEFTLAGLEQKADAARQMIGSGQAERSFLDAPTIEQDLLTDDLQMLLERLAGCGISRVYALDLSQPHLPVSVVRIVIPEL
ncbi:MAG: YcaO-like family protein, partial [Pseudomonadota bacterium]